MYIIGETILGKQKSLAELNNLIRDCEAQLVEETDKKKIIKIKSKLKGAIKLRDELFSEDNTGLK